MTSLFGHLLLRVFEIVVAFDFRRECPGFDITVVGIKRRPNHFESVRIHSQELWFEAGIETEHVLVDQNLSAHMWPSADAYSWNPEQFCYSSRNLSWHTLEHDREASGLLQLARLGAQN